MLRSWCAGLTDVLLKPAHVGEKEIDTELAGKINCMAKPVQPQNKPHVLG